MTQTKALSLLYFQALHRFRRAAEGDHDGTCGGAGCDKCFLTGVQPLLDALRRQETALGRVINEIAWADLPKESNEILDAAVAARHFVSVPLTLE